MNGWWWRRWLLGAGLGLTGALLAATGSHAATPKQAYADSLCRALPLVWNSETKPGFRFTSFVCRPGPRINGGTQTYVVVVTQAHGLGRARFVVTVDPDGTPLDARLVRRWTAGPVA